MFLVKSCFAKDHILNRKTIRIGTLDEYRNTVEAQIADTEEGFINLEYKLSDFLISNETFNFINKSHESENSLHIHKWSYLPSPMIPGFLHLKIYNADNELAKRNRYIFCISKLEDPTHYKGIFKKYDDQWNFKYIYADTIAQIISSEILKEIKQKISDGVQVFIETPDPKNLRIKYAYGDIQYEKRNIEINNQFMYRYEGKVKRMLTHGHFIKPKSFSIEREFRFVFDIYEGEKILHPLEKDIIINAEKIIPFLNK